MQSEEQTAAKKKNKKLNYCWNAPRGNPCGAFFVPIYQ